MRGDDDRLQGDRDHLGMVVDQPRHPQHQLLKGGGVDGRRAAPAEQQRGGADRPDQRRGVPVGDRDEAVRHVAEQLGGGPGEPEGQHGAGRRVDDGADHRVHPARGHPLHHRAQFLRAAEQLGQLGVRPAQLLLVRQVEADAAQVGAVPEVRGGRLEGDRVAEGAGGCCGGVRGGRGQGAVDVDAVGGEQFAGGVGGEGEALAAGEQPLDEGGGAPLVDVLVLGHLARVGGVPPPLPVRHGLRERPYRPLGGGVGGDGVGAFGRWRRVGCALAVRLGALVRPRPGIRALPCPRAAGLGGRAGGARLGRRARRGRQGLPRGRPARRGPPGPAWSAARRRPSAAPPPGPRRRPNPRPPRDGGHDDRVGGVVGQRPGERGVEVRRRGGGGEVLRRVRAQPLGEAGVVGEQAQGLGLPRIATRGPAGRGWRASSRPASTSSVMVSTRITPAWRSRAETVACGSWVARTACPRGPARGARPAPRPAAWRRRCGGRGG